MSRCVAGQASFLGPLDPEAGGIKTHRNVGNYSVDDAASQPTRLNVTVTLFSYKQQQWKRL
jgi:hypothetical protein